MSDTTTKTIRPYRVAVSVEIDTDGTDLEANLESRVKIARIEAESPEAALQQFKDNLAVFGLRVAEHISTEEWE